MKLVIRGAGVVFYHLHMHGMTFWRLLVIPFKLLDSCGLQ